MKKLLVASLMCVSVLSLGTAFAAEQATNVGGHIKMSVFDNINGTNNGIKGNQNVGLGINEFIMYIKKELSDTLALEVSPKFSWSTSATPTLGQAGKIGSQISTPSTAKMISVETLFFEKQLPDKYTARLGYFIPRFTWDYGQELFWEEEFSGNKFELTCGGYHDAGLEVYKEYGVAGISLPTYLYVLNGNGAYGNLAGGNYTLGFNVEPTLYGIKTHLAYFTGMYDNSKDAQIRRAIGAEYKTGAFEVRSEAVYNTKDRGLSNNQKSTTKGYEVKAFYKACPDFKVMLADSYAETNGINNGAAKRYKDLTLGGIYNLSEGTLLEMQLVNSDWRTISGSQKLIFNRILAGVRTTF